MSNNEITPEERERAVAIIKGYIDDCKQFYGTAVADAIQADYDDDDECWNKLLALIESAAPGKKSMKAIEFANKLQETHNKTNSIYAAIAECLGYNLRTTSGKEDVGRLCDAIRNLDMSNDGVQYPLDKDGVPIKPGDTVYIGVTKHTVAYIVYGTTGAWLRFDYNNNGLLYDPKDFTHEKPRTLDDIKKEAHDSHSNLSFGAYEGAINKLIDEAYEMGKANKNE